MRPSWLLVVLVLLPAVAPADAAPRRRPGRVVRVERPRHVDPDPIHACMVISLDEGKVTCYGREPAVGSTLRILGDAGVRGTGVVRAVAASTMMDTCRTGTAHDVAIELTNPLLTAGSLLFALQGVTLADDARALLNVPVPNLPSAEQARLWTAIDRDGDTIADMAVTAGECPSEVAPISPDGRRVMPFCLDYWLDDGHGYARAGRDIIYQCP